jgi:hypothetical protein
VPVVIIPAARLSELTSPERLGQINLDPKRLKALDHWAHIVYGDYNIVSEDTHSPGEMFYISLAKWAVKPLFYTEKDQGRKDHGLNRKGKG